MPKVSGIDFSALHHFRESAHIILLDGTEVELPLLPTKYATEGLSLLQRNDTLASRYAVLQTKLTLKAKALQKLQDDIGDDPDKLDELKQEEHLDTFDSVYKSMQTLQEQTAALCKESNALCEQIVEFLRPYISADIIEQLSKVDDFCTVRVLELMLYGEEALKSDGEGSETAEENPSTTASL